MPGANVPEGFRQLGFVVDVRQVYRQLVERADTLRPDDRTRLLAMIDLLDDSIAFAQAVRNYYRDGDRSDRTPRQIAYFHLGMLAGLLGAQ